MNKKRCPWVKEGDALYTKYHDKEWGVPVYDDQKIFEFLVLESFQAGLSWITILRKRANFKKAFSNFNPNKVAKFTNKEITSLLKNEGIIRNRAKIEATINNAKRFLEIQKEFGSFSKYAWGFTKNKTVVNKRKTLKDYPSTSDIAILWSKDLKKRGFRFLGPTTVYAHMQASGMVNDHTVDCFRYKELKNQNTNKL